jgi:hypothetical protein
VILFNHLRFIHAMGLTHTDPSQTCNRACELCSTAVIGRSAGAGSAGRTVTCSCSTTARLLSRNACTSSRSRFSLRRDSACAASHTFLSSWYFFSRFAHALGGWCVSMWFSASNSLCSAACFCTCKDRRRVSGCVREGRAGRRAQKTQPACSSRVPLIKGATGRRCADRARSRTS